LHQGRENAIACGSVLRPGKAKASKAAKKKVRLMNDDVKVEIMTKT
jgi:hypothetical protein